VSARRVLFRIGYAALGAVYVMLGIAAMKMISSTSMTSIIGVTFGEAFTPPELPADIAIAKPSPGYCEIGLEPAVAVVLNSRVKRERPNSPVPEMFLIM